MKYTLFTFQISELGEINRNTEATADRHLRCLETDSKTRFYRHDTFRKGLKYPKRVKEA